MTRMPKPGHPRPAGHAAIVPPIVEDAAAEHIFLADDSHVETHEPKNVVEKLELRDWLRGSVWTITLYEESFLRLDEARRGKLVRSHGVDLRYLDPVPSLERRYPRRLGRIAAAAAGGSALALLLAQFPPMQTLAAPAAVLAGAGAAAALLVFLRASHEKIVFCTLHGRAPALSLTAGLVCVRRFRAALPKIMRAIENAEEEIGDDTAIFLRAEMREHYRLRGDGVLSERECSESTGRILTHFDDEM